MDKAKNAVARRTYGGRAAAGLTVLGAALRLIPHPANVTPVGATSLFAGARLRGWHAYLVPLVIMAVTDPILSVLYGYPALWPVSDAYLPRVPAVYAALLINVWIGRKLLAKVNAGRLGVASALCSAQFFVLTNLGEWAVGGLYPLTAAGLGACFLAALPFLGRTLFGDLAYSGVLFGMDALAHRLRSQERQNGTVPAESIGA